MTIHFLRKIAPDGLFMEDVFWDDGATDTIAGNSIPVNMIQTPVPGGFIHPKWNGTQWVEGGSISLAAAKAIQISALTQAYQAAITSTVSYMSTTFQADPASVNNLNLSLAALSPGGSTPSGFYWLDASNNHVAMSLAQLQGLAAAMYAPGWSAFQNLQAKKASVNSASTVSDVQAITF